MIETLVYGNQAPIVTCSNCACQFRYSVVDIFIDNAIGDNGKAVRCPECGQVNPATTQYFDPRRGGGSSGGGTSKPEQEKSINIIQNGEVVVTPDEGYTLSKVTANVNVQACVENKLAQYLNRTIQTVTADDLNGVSNIESNRFMNYSNLESVVIPNNVVTVSSNAFFNCGNLRTVVIGNGVENLGHHAFSNCENLQDLTIGNSVKVIGAAAFSLCNSLTSVVIPNSVTTISDSAFYRCLNLSNVSIGNNVTSIGSMAFLLSDISNLVLPDSVVSIGNEVFSRCDKLESVTIGNGLTSIPSYAFSNCDLKSLNIPDNVVRINSGAFSNCHELENIVFGNGLTNVGNRVFWGCNNIARVSAHDLSAWCKINFSQSASNPVYDTHVLYINDTPLSTTLSIPNGVSRIGSYVFYNLSGLTSVSIPSSVNSIGYGAFSGCNNITRVDITDLSAWCETYFESTFSNPIVIAKNLYLNDNLVTDLVIPNSVSHINEYSFYGCDSLQTLNVPDNVTRIGSNTFTGCSNLTTATIGNGVTSIGISAFMNCKKLTDVSIGNNVTDIGSYAFQNCSSLTNAAIPNSVSNIYDYAFYGCSKLNSIELSNSVTEIGYSAFFGCNSVASVNYNANISDTYKNSGAPFRFVGLNSPISIVTIGDNVTEVTQNLFYNCGMTHLLGGNNVGYIQPNAFRECRNLTTLEVGANVYGIGSNAFMNCTNLSTLRFNASLHSAPRSNNGIFRNAGINGPGLSLIIGDNVYHVVNNMFNDLDNLTSITIGNKVNNIDDYAFSSCSKLTTINYNARNVAGYPYSQDVFAYSGNSGDGITMTFGDAVENIPTSLCSKQNMNLKKVVIGDNVHAIGNSAFSDCDNLTSIAIGVNSQNIDSYAFAYCGNVTEIYYNARRVNKIGYGVFSNTGKNGPGIAVTFGNAVEEIPDKLFSGGYDFPKITSVSIPNTVTSIGNFAFLNSEYLTSVAIPPSVTYIGDSALEIGTEENKSTITMLGETPPNIVFTTFNSSKLNQIIVPIGCVDTYKTTENWTKFADYIVEATE